MSSGSTPGTPILRDIRLVSNILAYEDKKKTLLTLLRETLEFLLELPQYTDPLGLRELLN